MKEVVEYIARNLVDDPDAVEVTETSDGRTTVVRLHVAPGDMGKVIGRGGRTARAIRAVVRVGAAGTGDSVMVEIAD